MTARELEQRNDELERSNRELNSSASIVSHDLKSPLQVVRGFIELLGHEGETVTTPTLGPTSTAPPGAERMDRLRSTISSRTHAPVSDRRRSIRSTSTIS